MNAVVQLVPDQQKLREDAKDLVSRHGGETAKPLRGDPPDDRGGGVASVVPRHSGGH
jgi:hypothetical protein